MNQARSISKRTLALLAVLTGVLPSACMQVSGTTAPGETAIASPSLTPESTETPAPTSTLTPSATATTEPTATSSPTQTPTASPTATYAVLRGEVNVEQVMCFYGPSRAYLFKYLLIGGSNLEIIGIQPDTGYIKVRAIGGDNPCWMNLEWMDVRGDIGALEPVDPEDILLPASPFYGALSNIAAVRNGDQVTISWTPLYLRAGDDSLQEPYLVEAWVCQGGELTFIPVGAYTNLANVIDEQGCDTPSHARVYGVEKHGYTRYVVVPWPDHD